MTVLLVALGAAVGGPLRHACATLLDGRWPRGTLLVNTLGSGLAGLFAALALGEHAWALVATGFCGALTSFSAFAVQAVDRGPAPGGRYVGATVLLALGACGLGYAAGGALV